ncbi:hypothetical protein DPEC_G00237600 [Dallia pectoralis]|uniref:Uncharacterized protein n=1 Tax=Dallia pectoralis TaxID=75939 RepID=A0ACC2FYR8_DALPE|nr:hypothetical protein DPEC_G00237600 [Dallia pectoralis]
MDPDSEENDQLLEDQEEQEDEGFEEDVQDLTIELLGVNYLLSQTWQPLQSMDPDSEENDQLLEDQEEQEDEGFEEDVQDLTIGSVLEEPPDA